MIVYATATWANGELMSETTKPAADGTSITIRRLLLCMLLVGGALAVWRLPFGDGIEGTAWMLLLSLTCLGAAIGAPFGKSFKGAIVGGGAAVVAIVIFLITLLAFMWGGR